MSLYVHAVHQWALWALDEIGDWGDTGPDPAKADRARTTFRTPIARSAEETARRLARR